MIENCKEEFNDHTKRGKTHTHTHTHTHTQKSHASNPYN